MTTFRGTVKDGQLVFPAEVAEQLGLHEGDAVEVQQTALTPTQRVGGENPFLAWIGVLPPFEDGMDAVRFTRELRDPDDEAS
ncbi:AbrB/MazE/SpoVT family DNA-binding domain-containing protein [Deinococcus altitudinis]|uniref:type II toxin-antitoxin system MazE family antitoxin n=1 Tax=Deinococcus altitudinis TaxID=468914 RepID=UPI003891626A